ncbi:MAG: hypothetical protein HY688_01215 [Chloroflexi bacterium]|nr:hypothetical protein [Chloroflexota bacterium]
MGIEESSHHREGLLVFPGSTNERWEAEQKRAELTMTAIAGTAERVLVWEW